jgi:uncharacterized protein YjcR
MAKKKTQERELAFILYMAGTLQKDICEKTKITPVTLQKWIEEDGWKERRAARQVSRPELVNKILGKISSLIEEQDPDKVDNQFSDKLIKLANTIEKLDKKNSNVVQDMETFMSFNAWLQSRQLNDSELTMELIKDINKFQDLYIAQKMSVR